MYFLTFSSANLSLNLLFAMVRDAVGVVLNAEVVK